MTDNSLLTKYVDILREEINVKEISDFSSDTPVIKIYKPLGSQISSKFGKDTAQIITNGKNWNVREIQWWIEVFDDNWNSRQLTDSDYEIAYQWLEDDEFWIDWNTIIKLDLNITPELKKEWIAREISRFLNQMRKDANFPVDARVSMTRETTDTDLIEIIQDFHDFFRDEALISDIKNWNISWDIINEFETNNKKIKIWLKK